MYINLRIFVFGYSMCLIFRFTMTLLLNDLFGEFTTIANTSNFSLLDNVLIIEDAYGIIPGANSVAINKIRFI